MNKRAEIHYFGLILILIFLALNTSGQMITGVWKGRINKKKAEIKIIQKGDSLLGTSYYYESENNYRRYTIKGYFEPRSNQAIWWDDQLIEEKTGKLSFNSPGKIPFLTSADFNCPGSDKMFLDGKSSPKDEPDKSGVTHLEKTNESTFSDEWDFIIDNYTFGANDPYYIDSVASIAVIKAPEGKTPVRTSKENEISVVVEKKKEETVAATRINTPQQIKEISIEEKFKLRERIIATEIPVVGDSIELRFYDNAEIDGDSISLFLNNKMLFQHIRLTANAYTIKLPVNELNEINELVMVAENLGSIPPNTSYMLAIVNENRYEAMLKSTEETSAVIRLVKSK